MTDPSIWSPGSDTQLVRDTIALMKGTSTTSNTIASSGTFSFTTQAELYFDAGVWVLIVNTADPTKWMLGYVVSYNTTTGVMSFESKFSSGSGTLASWDIYLSGALPSTIFSGGTVANATTFSSAVTLSSTLAVTGAITATDINATSQITSTAGDINLTTVVGMADADATLTAANIFNNIITITPTSNRVLTTPTAAQIVAYCSGYEVGSNFLLAVVNNSSSYTVTLSPGSGVSLVGKNVFRYASVLYRVRIDSASAVTLACISSINTDPLGITGTTSSSGNITLTSGSNGYQKLTPTGYGNIVKLPDATTLVIGREFVLDNGSGNYPYKVVNNSGVMLGIIPERTVSRGMVYDISTAAGGWGVSNTTNIGVVAYLSSTTLMKTLDVVDVGTDRELVFGYNTSTGYPYCVLYNRASNTFSSIVNVRAANVMLNLTAILGATNTVLVVTVTNGGTAAEAVTIDTSGATPVVKTPATFTLTAGGATPSSFSKVNGNALTATGGSFVFHYRVPAGASKCYAMYLTGFSVTVGTDNGLNGSVGIGSGEPALVLSSPAGIVGVGHNGTTSMYYDYYGVSGSTMTLGTGVTITSGTMTLYALVALGNYWAVLYNDGGSTVKASVLTLSGTTLTASTVTLFSAGVLTDFIVIDNTKVLVMNNQSSNDVNILTHAAGVASAGTAITAIGSSANNFVLYKNGSTVYIQNDLSTGMSVAAIDASGSSPVLTNVISGGSSLATAEILPPVKAFPHGTFSADRISNSNYVTQLKVTATTQHARSSIYEGIPDIEYPARLHPALLTYILGRNTSERWGHSSVSSNVFKLECLP